MAPLPRELLEPLAVIDELFAQRVSLQEGAPPAEWGERAHFVEALGLNDEEAFAKIPCLNDIEYTAYLRPFALVRYRCMVQDVFEPEIYAAVFEERDEGTWQAGQPARLLSSKYRDAVQPSRGRALHALGREGLSQRGAYYCVPLPGETPWARAATAATGSSSPWDAPATPRQQGGGAKRTRPEEDAEMEPNGEVSKTRPTPQARIARGADRGRTADDFGLNFPLPEEEQRGRGCATACIVKTYDSDAEALQLCTTVEIVGVLCIDAALANFTPMDFWDDARHPSTALVPRLHALVVRQLPNYHPLFPYSPAWLSEERLAAQFQATFALPAALAAARAAALQQLAHRLGGDVVAAEYALMLLVSQSYRKFGQKALGAWSLNVTRWPQELDARAFAEAAGELVPRAVCLELSVRALGERRWVPRKDFDANRVVAGQLQLAPGTLLVLDETRMAEGQLTEHGIQGARAVEALVTEQKLTCDFNYDVQVPLELQCMVVSDGKSIFKGMDVVLPLRPTAAVPAGAEQPALDAARRLLGLITRRPQALRQPEWFEHRFSEDFVAARQTFQCAAEVCNSWMCLARAQCITHGLAEVTPELWQATVQLELERMRRCQQEGMLSA